MQGVFEEILEGIGCSTQLFYESLVFLSDGNDFLDHVCFDYALIECPERLYDLLMAANDSGAGQLLAEAAKGHREGKSLN